MKKYRMLRALKFFLFAVLGGHGIWPCCDESLELASCRRFFFFGWHGSISGKAWVFLVLCKILFGGFKGRPSGPMHWRHRMSERWEKMTPEERDKFRQAMRGRCGSSSDGQPQNQKA